MRAFYDRLVRTGIVILILTTAVVQFHKYYFVTDNVQMNDAPKKLLTITRSPFVLTSTKLSTTTLVPSSPSISTSPPTTGKPLTTEKHVPKVLPPNLNFTFSYNDSGVCNKRQEGRRLIVMIFSAPGHFESRRSVRKTWTTYLKADDVNGSYYFIIGETLDLPLQKKIANESMTYGDIIQYDIIDSYRNLTYKTLAALKFLYTYCNESEFEYGLKTDDDIFVNIPQLLSFASQQKLCGRYHKMSFFCNSFRPRDQVPRDPRDKWYVSWEAYGEKYYPPFCNGAGYMFTWDLIGPLLEAAENTTYYPLEDVYTNGMCAEKVGNVSFVKVLNETFVHTFQDVGQVERWFKSVGLSKTVQPDRENCDKGPWIIGTQGNQTYEN